MNNFIKKSLLAAGFVCVGAFAQEAAAPAIDNADALVQEAAFNDWHIGIGLSYRTFKAPKFHTAPTSNVQAAYLLSEGPDAIDSLANTLNKAKSISRDFLYSVDYYGGNGLSHGSYSCEENTGFVLSGSYTLSQKDSLRISLVANFQYYQMDSASRHYGVNDRETSTVYPIVLGNVSTFPVGDPKDSSILIGLSNAKWDLDLYVIDLGASLAYDFENNLSAFLSLGPTISLADMESSSQTAVFTSNGDVFSLTDKHKNQHEFEFGYYVAGGASYWFNEKYGLSLELRYDKAFGDIGTRFVSQNLDAWGGMLKFLIRF